MAYGQTGAGKTFTMDGIRSVPDLKGIIPRCFADIFSHIVDAKQKTKYLISVSYYEVYNNVIKDLLSNNKMHAPVISESPKHGVCIRELRNVMVNSLEEIEEVFNVGSINRKNVF